jgi:antitoxin ParD1/3/4
MSVKASISLTETQDAFARDLVGQGRYPSLSAVMQQGLELLREQTEIKALEAEALRALIQKRRDGQFVDLDEGRKRTRAMLDHQRRMLLRLL